MPIASSVARTCRIAVEDDDVPLGGLGALYPGCAMATAKQDVRKILDSLPEEASLEDIQYHLYVLQRIERGRQDVEAGRIVPQDEVERRLAKWLDA